MHYVYVIYSASLSRYYIGETKDVCERIKQHNSGFFDKAYTSIVNDWILFLKLEFDNRGQARKVENHIKKMKSRKYIQDLKRYPEIVSKLKEKYK